MEFLKIKELCKVYGKAVSYTHLDVYKRQPFVSLITLITVDRLSRDFFRILFSISSSLILSKIISGQSLKSSSHRCV